MTATLRLATACFAILLGSNGAAQQARPPAATSRVTPGDLVVDPPTLINLGFEWLIDGDANRNAKVDVSYRKAGDRAWKTGLPLLRLQHEKTMQPNVFNLVAPNMFAGSILDLGPDTAYEARLVLSDPDGVSGPAARATRTVTVRTRPEPKPAEEGKVYHVYPVGYTGTRIEPSFTGIMCAYNYYCGAGDTAPGGRPRVKPGDIILVHAGTYAYRWELYANQTTINATTTFEGTYYLTADGTPDKPIVIKAAGDGEVILDGRNNFNLFNVKAADYNYFEGITFRNTGIAIWAGTQFIAGSKGLTVKRCRFEQVGMGVFTNYSGSSNFYIADSVFIGRNDPRHLIGWNGAFWEQFNGVDGQEFPPIMKSYTGIRLYGPGHVVAFNYVADFHDGIDTEMYGMPDGSNANEGPDYPPPASWDRRPVAIDIYNNYITNAHDNSIEMDGSMHNIRVMRNVLINSASHPMSTQPSAGGPIYWIRNIVYQAPGGSTRMTAGSPGVIFYHNTVTTETTAGSSANAHWRNNLFLGQGTVPAIFSVNTSTSYSSSDYNGFGPNPGAAVSFQWNVGAPPAAEEAAPPSRAAGYATLADYSKATGQDQHSITLDYDTFVNVPKLDRDPKKVQRLYDFRTLDFGLKPGSAAIDRGVALPNVNDGFMGKAPDLGALEADQPVPTYGPRTAARLAQNPLITVDSSPSLGGNVNGPTVIRVPDWVERPLGRYYMYFANHMGTFIRLAYADAVTGPWRIYEPGVLDVRDTAFYRPQPDPKETMANFYTHVASPEIFVDTARKRLVMWVHGWWTNGERWPGDPAEAEAWARQKGYSQYTQATESADGIHFEARPAITRQSYLRVFQYDGYYYGLTRLGRLARSRDPFASFELGPNPFRDGVDAGKVRHVALVVRGNRLNVFFTAIGDAPERVMLSTIDLGTDWTNWRASTPVLVLQPEASYECADLAKAPSAAGDVEGRVRQLRDPFVLEDGGESFLFYSTCGEQGIAAATLKLLK